MHEHSNRDTAPLSEWQAFYAANPDIQAIDAFIIDLNGNTTGKRLPAADGVKLYKDGVMYSACAPIADCRGLGHNAGGMGQSDGDPDGIARPLSGFLRRVPWAATPTAQALCQMEDVAAGKALWFDPCVFVLPPVGTFGNLSKNAVIGPGLANVDFALKKQFAITERTNLQFRAEAFNLFNHPNFGNMITPIFSGSTEARNGSAGRIFDTATTSRQIQFALRLGF